jgi:hypothetical protein
VVSAYYLLFSFLWVDLTFVTNAIYVLQFHLIVTRLIDIAPHYYNLSNFPQCEVKCILERFYNKRERDKSVHKNKSKRIVFKSVVC